MMSDLKLALDAEEKGLKRSRGLIPPMTNQGQNDVQSYEIYFPASIRQEYDRHYTQRNTYFNKEHDEFEQQKKMQKKFEKMRASIDKKEAKL